MHAAASIWFEIWGSWIRVKKISIFRAHLSEISIFSGNFTKFLKNFDFLRQFKKNSIFQAKIAHLQRLLGKLFNFSSKVSTFEHTSYMIRYNNISRPSTTSLRPSPSQNLATATPNPHHSIPSFHNSLH